MLMKKIKQTGKRQAVKKESRQKRQTVKKAGGKKESLQKKRGCRYKTTAS
jgi:hypothetical protein